MTVRTIDAGVDDILANFEESGNQRQHQLTGTFLYINLALSHQPDCAGPPARFENSW
jgi:hypothetical protein